MKLHLIRHGMTLYNKEGRYIGWSDIPLHKQGVEQLKKYLQTKNYPKGDIYLVSPMKRCVETLEILYPNVEKIQENEKLKEINFGDWEGKSYEELKDDNSYSNWLSDFVKNTPPNGEKFLEFEKRIEDTYYDLVKKYEKNHKDIVIVTHGGVIRVLMSKLIHNNRDIFYWKVPFGFGYSIDTKSLKYEIIE